MRAHVRGYPRRVPVRRSMVRVQPGNVALQHQLEAQASEMERERFAAAEREAALASELEALRIELEEKAPGPSGPASPVGPKYRTPEANLAEIESLVLEASPTTERRYVRARAPNFFPLPLPLPSL